MISRPEPAGFWPSALSAECAAGSQRRYDAPQFAAGLLYWIESAPEQSGRNLLMCWDGDAVHSLLPPPYSIRSRVNAYGGRAWTVGADGLICFVNDADQALYRLNPQGRVRKLLTAQSRSFADLAMRPDGGLLAVCEEQGARQYLVLILPDGQMQRLHAGFDFYSSPRPSPDGQRLAWICWNAPHMPWDQSEVWLGQFGQTSWLSDPHRVAGRPDQSWQQPVWRGNEQLVALGDVSGWWTPHLIEASGASALHRLRADCAHPPWIFGRSTHVWERGIGLLAVCRSTGWGLYEAQVDERRLRRLDAPLTEIESIARQGDLTAVLGASPEARMGIVVRRDKAAAGDWTWLSGGPLDTAEPISRPRRLKVAGSAVRSWYFPPCNAQHRLQRGERPPMIVRIHGGPTAAASSELDLRYQFWTSRGFAVLAVDYRGSSGAGRAVRQALYGCWGRGEVEDCRLAAIDAVRRGLADSNALFAAGSSAGALSALNLLVRYRSFAGAVSYYGVTDLAGLLAHGHRFEQDYTERLIAETGSLARRTRRRSPLHQVDRINRPVLFLQGLDDDVVPPAQSREMHAALTGRGIAAELIEFPGEGHGFRGAETIARALTAELSFYQRLLNR